MKRLTITFALAATLVFASLAAADVLVYQANFKKKKDVQRMSKLGGGKACGKAWKGKRTLGFRVKKGRKNCYLATPVEGDSRQPDHVIKTAFKISKKETGKRAAPHVYAGVALRANAKSAYELRVFPKGRRFVLLKNGAKLDEGKVKGIQALNKKNKLKLAAVGPNVQAKVNKTVVATFRDNSPAEVRGRKTALSFGNDSRSKQVGNGVFMNVKVFVPNP